jgi:hypothetical protein
MSKKTKRSTDVLQEWAEQPSYSMYPAMPVQGSPFRATSASVAQDNDATVASVTYGAFKATGSSKRERGDHYSPEIGELLASSRALHKMAARMERRANGLIKQQENIRNAVHKPLEVWEQEQAEREGAHTGGGGEVAFTAAFSQVQNALVQLQQLGLIELVEEG